MAQGILYIITNSYPEKNHTFNSDEFEFVLKNYSNVKIITFSKIDNKLKTSNPKIEYISLFKGIEEIIAPSNLSRKQIVKVVLKELYNSNFIDFLKNIYSFILALSILRSNNITDNDLVFAYWFSRPSRIAYFMYRLSGAKYICQGHGSDIYIYPPKNAKSIIDNAIYFITVGEENKKYICKKYKTSPSKILVHRLGVNEKFSKMIQKNTKSIINSNLKTNFITVANYRSVKGIDLLLEAINVLVKSDKINNNFLFKIYGSGNDKKKYLEYVEKMNLQSYVSINDWIGKEDLSRELASADAYVLPSRSEGLPVVLMEACAAALPIIATNVGCIREIAIDGYNAIISKDVSSESIAEAIENFTKMNSSARQQYSRNSFSLYKRYYILEENLRCKYDNIMKTMNDLNNKSSK